MVVFFAVGFAGLLAIRSGNASFDWMTPDQGFRQWLENVLVIRPRTKEFLFGQPLLLIGLYTRRHWIILLGMVGQVSIINTFFHVHTPLIMSLMRTLQGIWIGAVIGMIAIGAMQLFLSLSGNKRKNKQ
jgi:hypothetical protein